ncbi:MAG: HAMP domain-containing protein [Planctomycetota bacterium]
MSSIRSRILVVLCAAAIVSAGATALFGYHTARRALEEQSFNMLTAVREMKAAEIESYFRNIVDQVSAFSEDLMVIEAMKEFGEAFRDLEQEMASDDDRRTQMGTDLRLYYQNEFLPRLNANARRPATASEFLPDEAATQLAQHLYITSNPFDVGAKHLLDAADDGSRYSRTHGVYHPVVRDYLERFGYYDIFLVDLDGHIVYSVFKEVDFGTSLLAGPYRDSNIAQALRGVLEEPAADVVKIVDFEPYAPSYLAQASFIASPIHDGRERIGVLIFQMPVDRINGIMTSNRLWSEVGLGESGETYIVGMDQTLRNQSRFLLEDPESYFRMIDSFGYDAASVETMRNLGSSIGLQRVETEGTAAALAGESGTRIFPDYRGVPVLSSYRPLKIMDLSWSILSEIDEAEAFGSITAARDRVLVGLAILVVIVVIVAFMFARTLTRPIEALSASAAELARGNLETTVDTARSDEIGDLARSFSRMQQSLRELVNRQTDAIDALSTPLIPLHEQVMIMPLVGELDDRRLARVRETLVHGLHRSAARVAIIDITGVPALDQAVAAGLVRAARSARLLGAKVVITGMQPTIASALVDLDLDFADVRAERSLQRGIEVAMAELESSR